MRLAILLAIVAQLAFVSASAEVDPPSFILKWGSSGTGDGQFDGAAGLGIDAAGNVYVADALGNRIQKFSGDGVFLAKWGIHGSNPGQFSGPADVAVSSSDLLPNSDTNAVGILPS